MLASARGAVCSYLGCGTPSNDNEHEVNVNEWVALQHPGLSLAVHASGKDTGNAGHVQLVAVDAYRLTRSLLQTSDGGVRTDTM